MTYNSWIVKPHISEHVPIRLISFVKQKINLKPGQLNHRVLIGLIHIVVLMVQQFTLQLVMALLKTILKKVLMMVSRGRMSNHFNFQLIKYILMNPARDFYLADFGGLQLSAKVQLNGWIGKY